MELSGLFVANLNHKPWSRDNSHDQGLDKLSHVRSRDAVLELRATPISEFLCVLSISSPSALRWPHQALRASSHPHLLHLGTSSSRVLSRVRGRGSRGAPLGLAKPQIIQRFRAPSHHQPHRLSIVSSSTYLGF